MKKLVAWTGLAFLATLLFVSPAERQGMREAPYQDVDGAKSGTPRETGDLNSFFPRFKKRESGFRQPLAAAKTVDLSDQFPPGKIPDQGQIGSCHDFSAVALLEAAFYRHYKVHVPFSETDLFARMQMCSGEVCNDAGVYKAIDGSLQCGLGEGGNAQRDILFMLEHGVLTADGGSCASYAQFSENYIRRFQKPLEDALLKLHACGKTLPPVEPEKLKNTAERWAKPSPNAAAERKAVREALAGFIVSNVYEYDAKKTLRAAELMNISPEKCLDSSQTQREAILAELDAGRPVVVIAQLLGMKQWHPKQRPTDSPNSTANHLFLITGYRQNEAGRLTFQIRNSWVNDGKPYNPDVTPEELCHVIEVTTLLTPEEAGSAKN